MLYTVMPGDTLWKIAIRFGTNIPALLEANVICNPSLIFTGQVLIIPSPGVELPKAGGRPYYVVQPGDTLGCLARQFKTTVSVLAEINQITNPDLIFAYSELLIGPDVPNPVQLKQAWEKASETCDQLNSLQIYATYYLGSYQWEALGRKAIPYLLDFLTSPCDITRIYTVLSLGRIALNHQVKQALKKILSDPAVTGLAKLALRRIELAEQGKTRIHLVTSDTQLFNEPFFNAPSVPLPYGTEVIVRRWYIPSPTGEDFPPAGLAVWDQVQVVETGRVGYMFRVGYSQVQLM